MSYVYSVGYGSYEESEYVQITHDKKFTIEQLREMINNTVKKMILNISVDEHGYTSLGYGDDGYGFQNEVTYRIDFPDMMYRGLIDNLCTDYGFQRLVFECGYDVWGWANIFDNDWDSETNDEDTKSLRALAQNDPDIKNKIEEVVKKCKEIREKNKEGSRE